jgi:hypothetical protein
MAILALWVYYGFHPSLAIWEEVFLFFLKEITLKTLSDFF